nr:uncharacterized protein LOC103425956 [Malus domestica]
MTATVVPIVLNLKNYDDWSSRIKTYLLAENLWNVVEGSYRPPIREDGEFDDEAWEKKDAKALYAIQNSCGDDIYQFIKNETMAKGAWDTLSNKLKKPDEKSDEKVYMSVGEAYPTLTKPEVSKKKGAQKVYICRYLDPHKLIVVYNSI